MRHPAGCTLAEAITPTEWGVDVAPAEWGLRRADTGRPIGDEPVLTRQLATLAVYDLVLIDCPTFRRSPSTLLQQRRALWS